MLSVFAGEIHVNNTTVGNQSDSDNATNAIGRSVAVWTSLDGPTATSGPSGTTRRDQGGPEILVAGTAASDTEPAVSIDNAGNFVVVWTQGAGVGRNVLGQRFNAGGAPVGGLMGVAATNLPEFDPDVAVATGAVAGKAPGPSW